MTLTVIAALIAFVAGTFVGAILSLYLLPRIDCGVALDGDDRTFVDTGWEVHLERPFSEADEVLVQEALALVRPKPYPPPRLVR